MLKRPFWSRIAAFGIDAVFLAAVGWVVVFFAHEDIVRLGHWAPMIGFAIATLYFGATVARYRRTLGQAILGLLVVAPDDRKLSLARSFGRALVLSLSLLANAVSGNPWLAPLVGWHFFPNSIC